MLAAIHQDLVPLGVKVKQDKIDGKDIFGGYFLWLELPNQLDAETISALCQEREALIVAFGRMFAVKGDESIKFPNTLRLCFAWVEEDDLREGIQRLSRILKGALKGEITVSITKKDMGDFR